VRHWDLDPKHLALNIAFHTILEFIRSLDYLNKNRLFDQVSCPMLI